MDDNIRRSTRSRGGAKDANHHLVVPPYHYKKDPNGTYVEEEAELYHNPPLPSKFKGGVLSKDLRCIPPPPDILPSIMPDTGHCEWSWDPKTRVVHADFSLSATIMDVKDEKFLFLMMERDDVTVISSGIVSHQGLKPSMWCSRYIGQVLHKEFHHKIRRFDTSMVGGILKCVECDIMMSMNAHDYHSYVTKRGDVLAGRDTEKMMSYRDHNNNTHCFDVEKTILYMIDLDVEALLPALYTDFQTHLRLPGITPGGAHCMMSAVTREARPFMGPNLYMTPPASFTYFHQDGNGTVDSGHLCVSGYNEIVMLRRLTERHKKHALGLLTSDNKNPDTFFDGLYGQPHSDGLGPKPAWPTTRRIEECRKMGYCPTVCILRPGQMIHINKGRLHAFRKLCPSILPVEDCHAAQRADLVNEQMIRKDELCISVAWDWMFRGVTETGINREISATMSCAELNRQNEVVSLGIPGAALLQMARSISKEKGAGPKPFQPTAEVVCRGILKGLCAVVEVHEGEITSAREKGILLDIMERSDADQDPLSRGINPYGNSDYTCRFCSKELANVYCHCNGCDSILGRDFNICVGCHSIGKYKVDVTMGESKVLHSGQHHTGSFRGRAVCVCADPMKAGNCHKCDGCAACSCTCHSSFSMHYRFFDLQAEKRLVERVRLMGRKQGSYIEKFVEGSESKRCALFPLCLEDTSFCGGFQLSSCWCFKELLQALPTKEELVKARKEFFETRAGQDFFEATKKRNADNRRKSRGKRKVVNNDGSIS